MLKRRSVAVTLTVAALAACEGGGSDKGPDVTPALIVPGTGEGSAVSLSSVDGPVHVVGSIPLCVVGDLDDTATVTAVRPVQPEGGFDVQDFAVRELPAGSGQSFLRPQPGPLLRSWAGRVEVTTRCAGEPADFVDGSPHIDELVVQVAGVASASAITQGFDVDYELAGQQQTLSVPFPITVCPGQTDAGACE